MHLNDELGRYVQPNAKGLHPSVLPAGASEEALPTHHSILLLLLKRGRVWVILVAVFGSCVSIGSISTGLWRQDVHVRCTASSTALSIAVCGRTANSVAAAGAAAAGSGEDRGKSPTPGEDRKGFLGWLWGGLLWFLPSIGPLVGTLGLPRRVLATDFTTFSDLEGAIMASSALPFIIGQPLFWVWRGYRCLDGGLVDNCPVFIDGQRPQLVVRLSSLLCIYMPALDRPLSDCR